MKVDPVGPVPEAITCHEHGVVFVGQPTELQELGGADFDAVFRDFSRRPGAAFALKCLSGGRVACPHVVVGELGRLVEDAIVGLCGEVSSEHRLPGRQVRL